MFRRRNAGGGVLLVCLLPLLYSVIRVDAAGCPDVAAALARHNAYRAVHQAPPLVWNDTISQGAQAWAESLAAQSCRMQHSSGTGLGENLAGVWGGIAPQYNCSIATDEWYSEVAYYNWSNPGVSMNSSKAIGHFTQVVWKGTTQVGCGAANGTSSGMACQIQVCRYSPPGNMIWFAPDIYLKYRENVMPPLDATGPPPMAGGASPSPKPKRSPPPPKKKRQPPHKQNRKPPPRKKHPRN